MSLNIFIALCVLGLDVLIYFLFQWVLGENRRERLQRAVARQRAEAVQGTQSRPATTSTKGAAARSVIAMDRKEPKASRAEDSSRKYGEELVYRRLAASFAHPKPRT